MRQARRQRRMIQTSECENRNPRNGPSHGSHEIGDLNHGMLDQSSPIRGVW